METTLYERVGGHATFARLVHGFYAGIGDDPVLGPLYDPDDIEGAEWRLRTFLEQYFGGPQAYSQARGHPRLRMRHAPFAIGEQERDAWLARMLTSLDDLDLDEADDTVMRDYLIRAAHFMINSHG